MLRSGFSRSETPTPDASTRKKSSAMRYKRTDKGIDQIGRELGVDYVLEGSARREATRVRITAQLVQVSDQSQKWSRTYERNRCMTAPA
jgi:TolB-like protein